MTIQAVALAAADSIRGQYRNNILMLQILKGNRWHLANVIILPCVNVIASTITSDLHGCQFGCQFGEKLCIEATMHYRYTAVGLCCLNRRRELPPPPASSCHGRNESSLGAHVRRSRFTQLTSSLLCLFASQTLSRSSSLFPTGLLELSLSMRQVKTGPHAHIPTLSLWRSNQGKGYSIS